MGCTSTTFVAATISLVTVAIVGPKGAESSALAANHAAPVEHSSMHAALHPKAAAPPPVAGILSGEDGVLTTLVGAERGTFRALRGTFETKRGEDGTIRGAFVPSWGEKTLTRGEIGTKRGEERVSLVT